MPDLRKAGKANEPAESTSSGQSAILQAINSLRNELLAKMDEKAEMQISGLRDELKAPPELEMSFHNNTELDFISRGFGRWNE
ncbi:hypothetical protein Q7C36_009833 [Tachysurus vachellii]|uniref:Uncharacterized protein n=1 Tax=Tachysurus vachellii TaxID=175792 RepID=A0AA88N4G0_TACVA|nr:hypothetical protein Q7C36_009833 [Tachysurus vachellii]